MATSTAVTAPPGPGPATASGTAGIAGGNVVTAPSWDYPGGGPQLLGPLMDVAPLITVTGNNCVIRDGATGTVTVIG